MTSSNKFQIFTNKADASVTVHRYIVRMIGGSFSYDQDPSSATPESDYYADGSSFIEASDVMALSDGSSWSKHYNGGLYGRIKDCAFCRPSPFQTYDSLLTFSIQLTT